MLDKSIPYFNIIMRYDGPPSVVAPNAPEGYVFRSYKEGDDCNWARMEMDNRDFDSYENAIKYFRNKYGSDIDYLKERFIGLEEVVTGDLCGAVICWNDEKEGEKVSSVHWLVTTPNKQGNGLGKALIEMLKYKFSQTNGLPIYLHTQPWSYIAVGIYCKAGFHMLKKDTFKEYENQAEEALIVLKGLLQNNIYEKLVREMV